MSDEGFLAQEITFGLGLREEDRDAAVELFWEAFAPKLGRVLGPDSRAKAYLTSVVIPANAIGAWNHKGQLVGLAGIKTQRGGLIGGGLSELAAIYGWVGALWRGYLLDKMDRPLVPGRLSLDGLCVDTRYRGQGIGSGLIATVVAHAAKQNLAEVALDVIDSNPRARSLYVREGFEGRDFRSMGWLEPVFGFRAAETMVRIVR